MLTLRLICGILALTLLFSHLARPASAATPEEIEATVQKARRALKQLWTNAPAGGRRSLMAAALIKAGEPHGGEVEKKEAEALLKKIVDGKYKSSASSHEAIYEAGVDAMVAAEFEDPALKQHLLEAIAKFLISEQRENGSWDYIRGDAERRGSNGDTSVSQYACLGLWSAERSGVQFERTVWERVLNWYSNTAGADGSVYYNPLPSPGGRTAPQLSLAMLGSVHIAVTQINPAETARLLKAGPSSTPRPVPATAGSSADIKRFGILEAVPLDSSPSGPRIRSTNINVSDAAGQACRRVYEKALPSIKGRKIEPSFMAYYLYTLERFAAFANKQDLDGYDWYGDNADMLVKTQLPTGLWQSPAYGDQVDSSFILMFLVRATGKILNRDQPRARGIGGGLLAGGRGLPDSLLTPAAPKKRATSPVGDLLTALEKAKPEFIEEAQEELVEQVQLGDRDQLIGNKALIVELLGHPNVEVRRTAVWALGRTNDLSLARHLISALDDKQIGVAIEAHNALCWISRNPTAFDLPLNPEELAPEYATEEVKKAAIASWRRSALLGWGDWYLAKRPLADRGDDFETRLRARLKELR